MRRTLTALGDEPTDEALHAARIAVKRARYAADLAAHESAGRASASSRSRSTSRTSWGDHQDAVFSEARIRAWIEIRSGRVVRRLAVSCNSKRDRKAAARAAWPGVWQRLDRARAAGSSLSVVVRAAAGGIVLRDAGSGPEVLLVHRPQVRRLDVSERQGRRGRE